MKSYYGPWIGAWIEQFSECCRHRCGCTNGWIFIFVFVLFFSRLLFDCLIIPVWECFPQPACRHSVHTDVDDKEWRAVDCDSQWLLWLRQLAHVSDNWGETSPRTRGSVDMSGRYDERQMYPQENPAGPRDSISPAMWVWVLRSQTSFALLDWLVTSTTRPPATVQN